MRSPSIPIGVKFLPGMNFAMPTFLPPLVRLTMVSLVKVISGGNAMSGDFKLGSGEVACRGSSCLAGSSGGDTWGVILGVPDLR